MTIQIAITAVIILGLLVASMCACCYFLGRIDQSLANLKHNLPKTRDEQ